MVILWQVPVPWADWLDAYVAWVMTLGDAGAPIAFSVVACLFCAVSPTGYAPSVLAGVTFGPYLGPALAWFAVCSGAMLNLLWVRRFKKVVAWIGSKLPRKITAEPLVSGGHLPLAFPSSATLLPTPRQVDTRSCPVYLVLQPQD